MARNLLALILAVTVGCATTRGTRERCELGGPSPAPRVILASQREPALGDTAEVVFVIRHHCTAAPLAWALLDLTQPNAASTPRSTDSTGTLILRRVPGAYQLLARGIGFVPARATIEFRGGYRDSVLVELHPDRLTTHSDVF